MHDNSILVLSTPLTTPPEANFWHLRHLTGSVLDILAEICGTVVRILPVPDCLPFCQHYNHC